MTPTSAARAWVSWCRVGAPSLPDNPREPKLYICPSPAQSRRALRVALPVVRTSPAVAFKVAADPEGNSPRADRSVSYFIGEADAWRPAADLRGRSTGWRRSPHRSRLRCTRKGRLDGNGPISHTRVCSVEAGSGARGWRSGSRSYIVSRRRTVPHAPSAIARRILLYGASPWTASTSRVGGRISRAGSTRQEPREIANGNG